MPPPNLTSPNPHNSTSPLPPLTSPNSLNDQMTTLTITNPIPVPAQAAKQSLSTLPTELHLSLLSQNFSTDTDLLFLWSILRNVSKYWRSLTEEFVGRRWLPEVFIVFVFGKLLLLRSIEMTYVEGSILDGRVGYSWVLRINLSRNKSCRWRV